jgi:3-deoxy-D-manno-octulosonic-acid transferase
MHFFYNITVYIAQFLLKIVALFVPKIKLFVNGRKDVFSILKTKISSQDETIWFHAASLGEYEQGLPVMEQIKKQFPNHKIVLTFFSPSGFEVRKNNAVADVTVYLPLDTLANAKNFIKIINPKMVFFIKYEFWPNYLNQLNINKIPTYLVSGIFRENQIFFKWYGGFYRKCLNSFTHFFVQNDTSKQLLQNIDIQNITISGDTRFDRVFEILNRDNNLDFINQFTQNQLTFVAGSTWAKDEELLVSFINNYPKTIKYIIAPHNIKPLEINELKKSIQKKTILYSEINGKDISSFEVLILDTIGILTKVYSKANLVYVGGGFGNPGVHNVLEPAVFGVPIIIGKNYNHFQEAKDLVQLSGILSIKNQEEFYENAKLLLENEIINNQKGTICKEYVIKNKGATDKILKNLLNK